MYSPTLIINSLINFSGLLMSLQGLIASRIFIKSDRTNKRFFSYLFTFLIIFWVFSLITLFLGTIPDPSLTIYSRISKFIYCVSVAPVMPMITAQLIVRNSPVKPVKLTRNPVFLAVILLWTAFVAMLITAQFTTFIYSFSPDNSYHIGPLYFLLIIPPALTLIISLVTVIAWWKHFSSNQRKTYALALAVPLIGILVQHIFEGVHTITLGTVISTLILFVYFLEEHVGNIIRHKASTLALQMRPHFIFNTLTSIYYLCDQDPDLAKGTILDFTNYLRGNFTAIASEKPVSFKDELKHTAAYIKVEQVRFKDSIKVTYDTPYTEFRIPPLTLQPLAENAIKHGLEPDREPMELTIRSIKEDGCAKVIVENTGTTFSRKDNDDPHIALDNIRERLKITCRGTLTISPREGGGTVVTMTIPD